MAKGTPKSSAADVTRLVHEAVLALAQSDTGPLKLQAKKGDTDGVFPAGTTAAIKEAIETAKAADAPLLRVTSKQGKTEWVELAPAGVAAVGAAVAFASSSLPAVEGIRLAERVMAKRPETVVELEPLIARLDARRKEDDEREARQRSADAERQQQILAAMTRYQAGTEQRKRDRIAALQRELAELGGSTTPTPAPVPPRTDAPDAAEVNRLNDEIAKLKGELRAAKAVTSNQTNIAPEDSQEFVRNVARRLVGVWTEAADRGNDPARNAIEVAMSNIGAIDSIGEDGDKTEFDPQQHESATPFQPGDVVVISRPGWVLLEQAGVEYVIQKATVE